MRVVRVDKNQRVADFSKREKTEQAERRATAAAAFESGSESSLPLVTVIKSREAAELCRQWSDFFEKEREDRAMARYWKWVSSLFENGKTIPRGAFREIQNNLQGNIEIKEELKAGLFKDILNSAEFEGLQRVGSESKRVEEILDHVLR